MLDHSGSISGSFLIINSSSDCSNSTFKSPELLIRLRFELIGDGVIELDGPSSYIFFISVDSILRSSENES